MHLISGGNFVVLTPKIHWRFDKRWKDYYKIGGHVVHVHSSNFKEGQQLARQQCMNPWMQFCNFVFLCLFFTIFVSIIILSRLCFFFPCKWNSNALKIIFLNVFFSFFYGWIIILQMFLDMWCTIQELIIVFRWLIR
jgi:hypothetical protein